jgi:hypothetical protein
MVVEAALLLLLLLLLLVLVLLGDLGVDGAGHGQTGALLQDLLTLAPLGTTVLAHSARTDAENQGRGVPNYLGAAAIAPDGRSAWVPSKQDNVLRGNLRDGLNLDFQNTVRAISSRISTTGAPSTWAEDLEARVDHDNASHNSQQNCNTSQNRLIGDADSGSTTD